MIAQLDSDYIRTRPHKALVRVLSHLCFQGRFLTTEHRWLNRFILGELALLKRLPQTKPVCKPLFIIGTGRSGSTILGKVLSMHRSIGFLNEPKAVWYTICPQEDVNGHFTRDPAVYRLSARDATPQVSQAAHRILGAYLMITRSERVLDKNPEMIFRVPFVKAIFPDAKFILLMRNGWDTVSSIAAWSRVHGRVVKGQVEDWWGLDRRKWRLMVRQLVVSEPLLASALTTVEGLTRHEDMAAVEWIVTMQEGLHLMESMPDVVYPLRFEALTSSPDETLTRLLQFCELPADPVFLSYAQRVLKVVPSKGALDLDRTLREPFCETMRRLGYLTE